MTQTQVDDVPTTTRWGVVSEHGTDLGSYHTKQAAEEAIAHARDQLSLRRDRLSIREVATKASPPNPAIAYALIADRTAAWDAWSAAEVALNAAESTVDDLRNARNDAMHAYLAAAARV